MVRVYISSTLLDLSTERAEVRNWLADSGYEPVESYTPDSQSPFKSCLADIDSCDLYVLLLGHRYGHRPQTDNPENLSITHLEFRHAGVRNMPRIVLERANIPNVELSDIFDASEMESIKGFQSEVSSTLRPARFSDCGSLIAMLREGISKELKKLGLVPNANLVQNSLSRASRDLLSWPTTLQGGDWLERPELELLLQRITGEPCSLTLLLGPPGCGKSALLARLGQEMQLKNIPVLGIKADLLPEDILAPKALAEYLDLPQTVLATVQTLAEQGPVLVLVDQLDALADLVVQHSSRLRLLLNLIRDLESIPNVHIVASCREFERRHDPSLRNLDAEVLTLELLSWEAVAAVLESKGVRAGAWNPDIRETLRSPHALDTFLSLLTGNDESSLVNGFQGLLQTQWETKVLRVEDGALRASLLLSLANHMAERETLWLPLALFEDRYEIIHKLVADGLLILEPGSGRVAFRHQTLYEFVRARSFLNEVGSLTATVLEKQASLRIRPQLWHTLVYLRRVDEKRYQDELKSLWVENIRPHLRMLLIEFIGSQSKPLRQEQQIAFENFDDPWFQRRFLNVVIGSQGWFEALRPMHFPMLMARPLSEAACIQPLLNSALSFAPHAVLALVDTHWLQHPDKDELSWRTLSMGSIAPLDSSWVDRLERLATRMDLSSWAIGHAASVVSAALPEEAPRLFAAWLAQKWQACRLNAVNAANSDNAQLNFQLHKITTSLLESKDLYDLPAIAEAAPCQFVETIWPLFCEMLEVVSEEAHPFVIGYRQCHALLDHLDDEDTRLERPLLVAIAKAMNAWASIDPSTFLNFLEANESVDLLVVQRLLAQALLALSATYPQVTLEYICSDPRRLVIGPYSDIHKYSKQLIETISPHLNDLQFERLERCIIEWSYYYAQPNDDAKTRHHRLRWNREHRLRLLRSLPKQRVSPPTLRLIMEEERAFPQLNDWDVKFSGVHCIGSPVSAEQMQKAQDEDILNLFAELTDEHQWDHPRERMKGGAIQAGRELARLTENNAERVIGLIRKFPPGRNETPISDVLESLRKANYDRNATFSLIKGLIDKGHTGVQFHRACASAIEEAVDKDHPVPAELLNILESWLIAAAPASETVVEERSIPEHKESILWGHGGMVSLPAGNFPILAALCKACLIPTPILSDRWLSLLERHLTRTESPKVWATIAWRYLRWLNLANHARAEEFLNQLFSNYPMVLGTVQGIHLMAYLQHWVSPDNAQRWLATMAQEEDSGSMGSGELLMLRRVLFPKEKWAQDQINAVLTATEIETLEQRIGIVHAIVHLWPEPDHRQLAHEYLLKLVESPHEDILHALGNIFLSDAFLPDEPTRSLFDALCEHPTLLRDQRAEHLAEHLEALVIYEPKRVARLANALLDQVGEAMANISTAWYLSSESLLAVALALQDMDEPYRTDGVALFERMLEFNLPQAHQMTLDLDKRTPNMTAGSPPRRRRRRKQR